jgi:glycyl-tRNA synthetase beta chain
MARKNTHPDLLVEILTEELPPRSLARLSEAFSKGLFDGLQARNFLTARSTPQPFATPRRLAVRISEVLARQVDRVVERKGPSLSAGLDADGKPTPALAGFARSCGVAIQALEKHAGEKGEYFVYRSKQKGEPLAKQLAEVVETALKKLPVARIMRWGDLESQFVRPVHGLVMLHGKKVVPGTVLGLKSGNKTRGHRFLGRGVLALTEASEYEKVLARRGAVIASFEEREKLVEKQLDTAARRFGAGARWSVGRGAELVEEVASLVEYPAVYVGSFSKDFLAVPPECLITSMQQHQKYFPLADKQGRLLPYFLFVSNIKTARPEHIIRGNERVLRARLSDAKFFFDQDRKVTLASRLPRLANVVYHNKLGSQGERVERLVKLAVEIATRLAQAGLLAAADVAKVERAARLAKADLLTEMVGEFPELQGTMGKYYARHDGEDPAVAEAIEQHYWPRTAADGLPSNAIAIPVALAERLDALTGIFGIGLVPTGEKDPYGLRRQALGVVRLLAEKALPLDLVALIELARDFFPREVLAGGVVAGVHGFVLERLKPYLRERGFLPDEIEAVLSQNPTRFDQVLPRLTALQKFRELPEAEALAAANKRIRNILRQAEEVAIPAGVNESLLSEDAERELAAAVRRKRSEVSPLLAAGDYTATLSCLASLRPTVDGFFDRVMVMADDAALRGNRLALLKDLNGVFLQVADISKLQS